MKLIVYLLLLLLLTITNTIIASSEAVINNDTISSSPADTLYKPNKHDLKIIENCYPLLKVEKWNYKIKYIYYPCDSCVAGGYLIFEGFK